MTEDKIEFGMQLLAAMTVMDFAKEHGKKYMEVYKMFRRSRTFGELFDAETGLWMNGPLYISREFELEQKMAEDS